MEIPRIEYSVMTLDQKKHFFAFNDLIGLVIPPLRGFAIAYDSPTRGFMGVILSLNGEAGYEKRKEETVLIRTCETYLGRRPFRTKSDLALELE